MAKVRLTLVALVLVVSLSAGGCRAPSPAGPPPVPPPCPERFVLVEEPAIALVKQPETQAVTPVEGQEVRELPGNWVVMGVGMVGGAGALAGRSSPLGATRPKPCVPAAIPRDGQEPVAADPSVVHTGRCPEGCAACTRVIEKGLAYLLAMQKSDGRWESGQRMDYGFVETALCGLALLAEGSTTRTGSRAEIREALAKAVTFLAERVNSEGQLRDPVREKKLGYSMSRLEVWRLSFAATLLAEVYRKDGREDLRPKLEVMRDRLEGLQRVTGGYCHDLHPREIGGAGRVFHYSEDLVVATSVAVMALGTLEHAGIPVTRKTLERV